jgi:hypothetical protein
MESFIPPGHPGDFVWRLPLIRALQGLNALKAAAQERALAATKKGGFLSSHLIDAGVPADKVLTALSVATGLKSAAPNEVRRPEAQLADLAPKETCRILLAVPFKRDGDALHIAYVVPPAGDQTAIFPLHTAYIALEADVRMGLTVLYGPEPKGPRTLASSTAPMTRPDLAPPTEPVTTPIAAATQDGKVVALEKGAPTAREMAAAGLIETGMSPMEENLMKLKVLRWPLALVVVMGLGIWGVGRLIKVSRSEVESKGSALNEGFRQSAQEIAQAKGREMGQDPAPHLPGQGNLDAVIRTQAELDVVINTGRTDTFYEACHRFASNLALYVVRAPTVQQQVDLKQLSMEAMVMCETEQITAPVEHWKEFKSRLMRVMQGENPLPGPRYQLEMPAEVARAIHTVDRAVEDQDPPAICKAMGAFRSAMYPWVERFPPGPRMMRMHRTIEEMDGFMLGCEKFPADSLRTSWARIKKDIGPEE